MVPKQPVEKAKPKEVEEETTTEGDATEEEEVEIEELPGGGTRVIHKTSRRYSPK